MRLVAVYEDLYENQWKQSLSKAVYDADDFDAKALESMEMRFDDVFNEEAMRGLRSLLQPLRDHSDLSSPATDALRGQEMEKTLQAIKETDEDEF